MSQDIFDLSYILGENATEKEEKELTNEAKAFFGEDDGSFDIPVTTSVKQGDVSKVQNVDEISRRRREEDPEDGKTDLALFDFGDDPEEDDEDEEEPSNEPKIKSESKEDVEMEEDPEEGPEEDSKKETPISMFAKELKENGILEGDVEDIKDFEALKAAMSNLVKDKGMEDLNEDQKKYLDALRSGLTHEFVARHNDIMARLNDVTDEDLKDEALAKEVYQVYLEQKGFNKSKIERTVRRAVEDGALTIESKEALDELKQNEKARFEEEKNRVAKEKKALEDEHKKVQSDTEAYLTSGDKEIIPGIKITKAVAKEIMDDMTSFPYVDEKTGRKLNSFQKYIKDNPAEYRAVSYYLFKKGFFSGKPDLKGLKIKAETEAINKFERFLNDEKSFGGGKHRDATDKDLTDSILDAI